MSASDEDLPSQLAQASLNMLWNQDLVQEGGESGREHLHCSLRSACIILSVAEHFAKSVTDNFIQNPRRLLL